LQVQLGLLKRLGNLEHEPLVDALRDLHTRREGGVEQLQKLLASSLPIPSRPIVGADTLEAAEPTRGADYETARRHFVDHGRRLREQAFLAERLLDAFVRRQDTAPAVASQSELTVRCAREAIASADFFVVNREGSALDVRFDAFPPSGCDGDGADAEESAISASRLSFDPSTIQLAPGQEAVVRLTVDLRGYRGQAGKRDVGVDIRGNERLLVRLWIHVDVTT
jgi:hypothetical protein